MNTLKPEKKLTVQSALVEGNSIGSTERMTAVHQDAIMRLLSTAGDRSHSLMDAKARCQPLPDHG